MKVKRLRLFITLFLVVGLTFIQCHKGIDCNCTPVTLHHFDVIGIESLEHEVFNQLNYLYLPDSNEVDSFKHYSGFKLNLLVDYVASVEHKKPSFTGFGQLNACWCVAKGEMGSVNESIKDITVVTLNDFSAAYKANDTINFLISAYGNPLDDYVEYARTSLIVSSSSRFTLNEPPSLDKHFKVKLFVELNTGEKYEKTTSTIIIN